MQICKQLEKTVLDQMVFFENIKTKTRIDRKIGNQGSTHINFTVSHDKNNLSWINISFQHSIHYQFTISFNRFFGSGNWYHSVQFGSDFYNQSEKEQTKRIRIFERKFKSLIESLSTIDENHEKLEELLNKKQQIEREINEITNK